MARGIHRLTAAGVRNAKPPAMLHDGGGLYLQVAVGAEEDRPRKSWLFRYTAPTGKRREMGLGPVDKVSLAAARDLVDAARATLGAGLDPIDARDRKRAELALEAARAITFRQAAEAYVAAHEKEWRNAKHAAQWTSTLKAYAYPVLEDIAVADVDVTLVLKVLEPIWETKRETASRVRGRIEAVLDWATVRRYRVGENPARWRGHLQKALPAKRAKAVKHHAALPFAEAGAFMAALRDVEGLSALALEFTILTATRSGEALGATWAEIDTKNALWTIPPVRMKAHREHRVPLSKQALVVLGKAKLLNPRGRFVFPSTDPKKPLSNMAMAMTLRRMKRGALTVHGFRSTFRDWAGEMTNFPREIAEAALAHVKGDKVEAAYRRGDALEKRRKLMQAWADYCDRSAEEGGAVVEMKRKRKADV